ncbi:MAG: hypothetical protein RXQ56_01885 [Thermoproteus sp.]|jgi:hypothetical protein
MMELKKYVTSKHLLIAPFLDVRCLGVDRELCTDRKEVRLVRYSLLN